MTNGLTYRKEHLTVFDLNRVNRKKYWKCKSYTFILPHKREYSLLRVRACSRHCWENTQAKMCRAQNIAKTMQLSLVLSVLTKKSTKNASVGFFILPHKREYGLKPVIACSRNCWENTQDRMLQELKYHIEHVAVFDFICTNKKKTLKCEHKTYFWYTSENTVYSRFFM